ncbi:hypothetical protein BegalDRAFT_1039 [Beggiatoa alba B18LD]|uniref:Uncharacterized protein n=1 Tax=Beggiatoa alba B18LD TaxID=395493 RepID=I3CE99_9GAMM|nr:hypothetical protein [Beggiatoa alba]EIJ41942.1 hypothetical protein BegalDRAFT_1039 [Beggiatoa alba B18LD]
MDKNYYSLSLLALFALIGCEGIPSVNDKPVLALVPAKANSYTAASAGFSIQSVNSTRTLTSAVNWQEEQTVQALFKRNDIDALTRYLENNINNQDKYAYVQRVWTERDIRCKKIAQEYSNSPKNETVLEQLSRRYQYSCPQVVADFEAMTRTGFVMQPATPETAQTTLPSPVTVATAPRPETVLFPPQTPSRVTPLPAPMPTKAIDIQPRVVTPAQPATTIPVTPVANIPTNTVANNTPNTPATTPNTTLEAKPVSLVDQAPESANNSSNTPTPSTTAEPTTTTTASTAETSTSATTATDNTQTSTKTVATNTDSTSTATTESTASASAATDATKTPAVSNATASSTPDTTQETGDKTATASSSTSASETNPATVASVEPPAEPRPASDKVKAVKDEALPKHKITTERFRSGWKIQIDVTDKNISREQCLALLDAYRNQAGSEGQLVVRKPSTLFGDPVQQPWCIDMLDGQNVVFNDYFF